APQDRRHAVMYLADQFIGGNRDDRERPDPFVPDRGLPVLPQPGDAERRAVLHRNGEGLLSLLPLDRLPLEEAVDRQDAPPPSVCISERRQRRNRLGLGVDRPAIGRRADHPMFRKQLEQMVATYTDTRAAAAEITTRLITL